MKRQRMAALLLCAGILLVMTGCDALPDGTLGTSARLYGNYYMRVERAVHAHMKLSPGALEYAGDAYSAVAASSVQVQALLRLLEDAEENGGAYEATLRPYDAGDMTDVSVRILHGKPESTFSAAYTFGGRNYVAEGTYNGKTESLNARWNGGEPGDEHAFSYVRLRGGGYVGQIVLYLDGTWNEVRTGFQGEEMAFGICPLEEGAAVEDVYGKSRESADFAAAGDLWIRVKDGQLSVSVNGVEQIFTTVPTNEGA